MKVKINVVYSHEIDGVRKQDMIDIELKSDRKAYTEEAFNNYLCSILKGKGVVNPHIESIGQLEPFL